MSDQERSPTLRERQFALLSHAERIAGLGSWEWTPDTNELLWTDNLFRLLGLDPSATTPSPRVVIERVHPDDRRRVRDAVRALADGRFHDAALEYRIVRGDGTLVVLATTIAASVDGHTGVRHLRGAVQDVTLRRRLQRNLAAHMAVTQGLEEWISLEQGAQGLLARLAQAMELAFAALWIPDGRALVVRAMWRLPSPAIDPLVAATRSWNPGLHAGGVGRAFATRRPIVAADAAQAVPAARRASIRAAGIEGAMLVPAVYGDETLAVLELLSFDRVEQTEQLLRALDGIGQQVGHFLSRRRGELAAPVLTARELAVLQLAANGRSASSIATELHLSPATVKRHFERAYAALDLSDRAAAVGEAMRRGLIT